jgi:hypothetical protein
MPHFYPRDLATFVAEQWDAAAGWDLLPSAEVLEQILSTCYQTSLQYEEQRRLAFRLLACPPNILSAEDTPPTGLHRLIFSPARAFDEHELRRLSPAADFHRSLIGAHWNRGQMSIWGLVQSGPRWLQAAHGGRHAPVPMPPALVICVKGPGQITVCQGNTSLAMLNAGSIFRPELDVFDSAWLPALFAEARRLLRQEYVSQYGLPANTDPNIIERLTALLAQHVVRRIVSLIRAQRHGGTVLMVELEVGRQLLAANTFLQVKYRFMDEEPRRRFRTLVFRIVHRLQALAQSSDGGGIDEQEIWNQFLHTADPLIAQLDEAIFEVAHLVANLAGVDGAVLMTKRFEILGFGSEISGSLPEVETVRICQDAEGLNSRPVRTDGVGTRHRSAFRFCQKFPSALAIVVSQDGNIRFVAAKDGSVHCWDQVSSSFLDV